MVPNSKDIAEFARLGLGFGFGFGVMATPPIVSWADRLIAEQDQPPLWAIDLAVARPEEMNELLKQIPGEPQGNLPLRLFLAYVHHLWNTEKLTIGDVRAIGRDLYRNDPAPGSDSVMNWGLELECECDEVDYGWGYRTEVDIRESINQKLAKFSDVEPLLPSWVWADGEA